MMPYIISHILTLLTFATRAQVFATVSDKSVAFSISIAKLLKNLVMQGHHDSRIFRRMLIICKNAFFPFLSRGGGSVTAPDSSLPDS